MKKYQFKVRLFLSVLAILTSMAAAPMKGRVISLDQVRNDMHGGVTFIFSVSGHFSKPELKGIVQVQGEDANYKLYCSQVEKTKVRCTTSKKVGGKNVVVTFGGSSFWTRVPPGHDHEHDDMDMTYSLRGLGS